MCTLVKMYKNITPLYIFVVSSYKDVIAIASLFLSIPLLLSGNISTLQFYTTSIIRLFIIQYD